MTTVKVTVLGCGPSGGIPLISNFWGKCDPKNPRNKRLRSSIYVEFDGKKILVDTSPDLRYQFLLNNIDLIDAVLYTHIHADHVHGLNDLGTLCRRHKRVLPVYGAPETLEDIEKTFGYAFHTPEDPLTIYKPFLKAIPMTPPVFEVLGTKIIAFEQDHGSIKSLGFRFGNFTYSTDVCRLSPDALDAIKGSKVWVVDCLQHAPHETHSYLEQTLKWIDIVKPQKAYLTHLGPEMDYETLMKTLPPHVEPAYDGLLITLTD